MQYYSVKRGTGREGHVLWTSGSLACDARLLAISRTLTWQSGCPKSTLPSECTGNGKQSCITSQGSLSGVELAKLTIVPRANKTSNGIVAMTRRDSALEAFRHNPTGA